MPHPRGRPMPHPLAGPCQAISMQPTALLIKSLMSIKVGITLPTMCSCFQNRELQTSSLQAHAVTLRSAKTTS